MGAGRVSDEPANRDDIVVRAGIARRAIQHIVDYKNDSGNSPTRNP
jgi:hypothetical protein